MNYRKSYCVNCGEDFNESNTHSIQGWAETRISGLCEDCFDECTKEDEPPENDCQ